MSTYKVPQDVEAEDKFLGPLTFKQFLFAGGAAITGYTLFIGLANGWYFLSVLMLPFFIVCGFLGFPWTKDQPTELWLASRIRFLIVPRKRIWDQTGMKDLVTITVPKKEIKVYTDGLNQHQVKSRLNALATIVDTRGWAIKNHNGIQQLEDSDRLTVGPQQPVSLRESILSQSMDVMDERTNPLAQQFDNLIQKSSEARREETIAKVKEALVHDLPQTIRQNSPLIAPQNTGLATAVQSGPDPVLSQLQDQSQQTGAPTLGMGVPTTAQPTTSTDEEQQLLSRIHHQQEAEKAIQEHSRLKTLQPIEEQPDAISSGVSSAAPVDPAILALADNNDLTVATIARNINKNNSDDEVVISLR